MDLIDYSNENETKKIRFLDEGMTFYGKIEDKPEIEQDLFRLQDEYYNTTDKDVKTEVWSKMLILCQVYARSLTLKKIKGGKFVDPDVVSDRATRAALVFMSQYIYRPGFHCGASFGGLLYWKVVEAFSKDKDDERLISLNTILSVNNNNAELESFQEKVKFEHLYFDYLTPEDSVCTLKLKECIDQILLEIDEVLGNNNEKMRFLIRNWFSILLKKPRNKHVKKGFMSNWCDYKTKKIIDLATLELKNRLIEVS